MILLIRLFIFLLVVGYSIKANSQSQTSYQSQDENQEEPEVDANEDIVSYEQSQEAEELKVAGAPVVRRFHQVLDELLAEFGYDVKKGQIKGLKNVAIRKVTVSDTLPRSYTSYVELLAAERIRENSQVRLITCVSCKSKTSRVADGKLIITSPTTNLADMERAAEIMGIDYFIDIVLVYHTTHMVLAFQAFNTDTKEMTWARTYNSETIKSRFQKLAVDYSQVEKSRPGEDYQPDFRYLLGLGGASVPNVTDSSDDNSFAVFHIRGTEKFDNRHNEFGLILELYQSTNALLSDYPTSGSTEATEETTEETTTEVTLEPFTTAIGLYGVYAHNFLGTLESYNQTRYGVNAAAGILLASSYLAPTLRFGVDTYFGRAFGITASILYVTGSKILVNNEFQSTTGGAGGSLAMVYNF